jgi:hypothetical protein
MLELDANLHAPARLRLMTTLTAGQIPDHRRTASGP